MDPSTTEILEIIGGIVLILTTLGAGFKWLYSVMQKRATIFEEKLEKAQNSAKEEKDKFNLFVMEQLLAIREENRDLKSEILILKKHIGVLEGILIAKGEEIPPLLYE